MILARFEGEQRVITCLEELKIVLENNKCIIYGAGKVSATILKFIEKEKIQHDIEAIVVMNMKGNPEKLYNIRVTELKNINLEDYVLIVCTAEKLQSEIADILKNKKSKKVEYVSDKLYQECNLKLRKCGWNENMIEELKRDMFKFIPKPCMEYMVLNILDHCNLRCKGCDHFACISEPYFVPYQIIHNDLKQLSEIMENDYVLSIGVMGGEPLLHPDLLKILEDVRKYFPYTKIRLTTNGLLLLNQPDIFWETLRLNDVVIVNTRYPINIDYEKISCKAKEAGIEYHFFEGTEERKVLVKRSINLNGDSNPVEQFSNCDLSNFGNFLMEGKLYGCPFSCQSWRIFNKKFDQNLRMTNSDYLDIYKIKDKKEIFEFSARPRMYCRYCNGLSTPFEWSRTKQEISEWVDEEISE